MPILKYLIILIISVAAILLVLMQEAIPQDPIYHAFADQRDYWGIPNVVNVLSNIPYLFIGGLGIYHLYLRDEAGVIKNIKFIYYLFFIAVTLVGMGSACYHLEPANDTLVWDRLPMALAFMAFFSLVIAEYINVKVAKQLFGPFVFMGLGSVIYWYWSESSGQGDLRFYVLIQFLPIILIPVILWLFRPSFSHGYYYWMVIGCYLCAKLLELMDYEVFNMSGFIAGHSLKHLISALAAYLLYRAINIRYPLQRR